MPGYGFAFAPEGAPGEWQTAMSQYVKSRGDALRVLLCIDARQSLRALDRDFILMLEKEAKVKYFVVMTKCDLVKSEELAKRYSLLEKALRELSLRRICTPGGNAIQMVSSRTTAGVAELRRALTREMPQNWIRFPEGTPNTVHDATPSTLIGGLRNESSNHSASGRQSLEISPSPTHPRSPHEASVDAWLTDVPIGRAERRRRARDRDARAYRKNPSVASFETWVRRRKKESGLAALTRGTSRRRTRFGV